MKKTLVRLVSLALILVLAVTGVCATQWWNPLAVERQIYSYLTEGLKLSSAAACGILANIEYESAFQVTIIGDHGTSFGLCQWHNERYTALRGYCMARGLDYRSVEGQMAYLGYELKSSYISLYAALRSLPNTPDGAYQAAYLWCIRYERPVDMEQKAVTRGNAARYKYWNRYNSVSMIAKEEPTYEEPEDLIEEITENKPALSVPAAPQKPVYNEHGLVYVAPKPDPDQFPGYHGPSLTEPHSNGYTGFAVGVLFMILSDGRRSGWYLPEPEESREEVPEDSGKNPGSHLHIPPRYDMIEHKR